MSAVLWGVRAVAKINLQRVFADIRIKNLVPRYRVKWFESFDKSYLNALTRHFSTRFMMFFKIDKNTSFSQRKLRLHTGKI